MSKPTQSPSAKRKAVRATPPSPVILERGQIWKAGESYVQIQEAGPRLIHYKMATTLDRPGLRKHLASIKTVQAFLKSRRAKLLPALTPSV